MKKNEENKQSPKATKAQGAKHTWADTLAHALLLPIVILCFIYIILFFFLNSSLAPKVLNTALSSFLKGDYDIHYSSTDSFLQTIYLDNVRLSEPGVPGNENAVIYAPYANAKIPLIELFQLVTSTTLNVGTITAFNPVVRLDFTGPELNILNVVLPYNMSDEEDTEPGTFVLKMNDLNATNGHVILTFDGFTVDLLGCEVKHYGLKVANGLEMYSPMVEGDVRPNVFVHEVTVTFNPAMFSFPLSRYGDKNVGLVFSSPSGSTDQVAQAFAHMGIAIAQKVMEDALHPEAGDLSLLTEKRGDFVAKAYNVSVNGFRWFGNEFEITDTRGDLSTGKMRMTDAWMNVAPTQADIDAAAKRYHNIPSGEEPGTSPLWAAKLDVDLPVNDPVMRYFFGDLLKGTEQFHLRSSLSGDIAKVDGNVSLELPPVEVFGINLERTDLKAYLDGQKFNINSLEAESDMGSLYANGYYMIMDGDFDIDLYTGQQPKAQSLSSDEFAEKLAQGLAPLKLFDSSTLKKFSGSLSTHLKASSHDGVMAVDLIGPIEWNFDKTIAGSKNIRIQPIEQNNTQIIAYNDNILTSPAGMRVSLNDDYINVQPGLSVNLFSLEEINADVEARLESVKPYAQMLGLNGVTSGPVDLSANLKTDMPSIDGRIYFHAEDVNYDDFTVNFVHVDLNVDKGKVTTNDFKVKSPYAELSADLNASLIDERTNKIYSDPMDIPVDGKLTLSNVRVDELPIPALKDLKLDANAGAELTFRGTAKNPRMLLNLDAKNITVMDEHFSDLTARVRYSDNVVSIPFVGIWLDRDENEAESQNLAHLSGNTADSQKKIQNTADAAPFGSSGAAPAAGSSEAVTTVVAAAPAGAGTGEAAGSQNSEPAAVGSSAIDVVTASSVQVEETRDLSARRGRFMLRNGKRADLSVNTFTYDINKGLIAFNAVMQPVSPNEIQMVKQMDLPVQGTVSFDLSANIDIDFMKALLSGSKDLKSKNPSWIEGDVNLNGLVYDDITIGDSQLQFSRSSSFIFIKGHLTDYVDVSGFVRTNPTLTATLALDFPSTDVLGMLNAFNIDLSSIVEQMQMESFIVSGSVGFCYKGSEQMTVTAYFDDIHSDLLGERLELANTSYLRYDFIKQQASVSSLDFVFKSSRLKLAGDYNLDGTVNLDINGEIDGSITRVLPIAVKDVNGVLSLSVSANGNIYSHKKLSMKNLNVNGFIGVHDPIEIATSLVDSPVVLNRGFIYLGRDQNCPKGTMCIVTPPDQTFLLGIGNQENKWLELSLMATDHGDARASVTGELNAGLAQLFLQDITDAAGSLNTDLRVEGRFLDKHQNLEIDLDKFKFAGGISVKEPISIALRSLNDPIELNSGTISIADKKDCTLGDDCVIIRKDQALIGQALSGPFVIFGEVRRNSVVPLGGFLTISGHNLNYRMKDELNITVSPDLTASIGDINDFGTYNVTGNIDLLEASYNKNFDADGNNLIRDAILGLFVESKKRVTAYSPSILRKYPDLAKIGFNIDIEAENAIKAAARIASATVELEVSTVLNVAGNLKEIQPSGNVNITSGLISLQGNEFEFQPGSQITFAGSLDGKLEIVAQSEINTTSSAFASILGNSDLDRRKRIKTSQNQSTELYIINLNVSGSLFNPTWNFDCSPYLSDANIYALILTGKTIDDIGGADSSAMNVAMGSLISPLFSSQLDSFIKMDEFKFLFSDGAAQIVFVKQINKGLRLAAGVALKGAEGNEQAVSGEYYFNDRWSIDLTGQNTADEKGKAPTFKLSSRVNWHIPIDY